MSQIKKLREAAGLSHKQLADKVKVAEITVRKWESKERTPRVLHLKRLAKALGCQAQQLI